MKAKAKDSVNISQKAAQIINGVSHGKERDNVCPRCDHELFAFRTAAGLILRCRGWDIVGIPCTLIKVSRRGRQFHREKYQPYRRWKFGEWLWWPTRCSTRRLENEYATRTRQWISKSNSQQRLDSSDASLDVQPRVGARTIRSVANPSSTLPTSPESTTARSVIEPGVVADVPALRRGRQIRWGPVEHGYEWIRPVCSRLVHEQMFYLNQGPGRCVESQPNFETKGASLSVPGASF